MRVAVLVVLLFARIACAQDLVRLAFVGDIMLDDGPGQIIAAGGDPLAAFDPWLRRADFAIGNLECPVAVGGTELENKIVTFRARPEAMRVLRGRFAGLSVANNHSGDYGTAAFLETIHHVQAAGIRAFGGGTDLTEAHAPLWLEKNGVRIALLAYNEYKPRRFEAGPASPGIAWSEDSHVRRDIRAARAAGANVVIPFMHWGWENERAPTARQRQLAALMIKSGADAVVGAHPHVTQGADIIAGKPVIWSLGNFVFDGFGPGPGREGWGLEMSVDKAGVTAWRIVPAAMDEAGTPTPAATPAPCGQRGDRQPQACPGHL